MSLSPIRYVSFDCHGTLVDFRVGDVARNRLATRVVAGVAWDHPVGREQLKLPAEMQ